MVIQRLSIQFKMAKKVKQVQELLAVIQIFVLVANREQEWRGPIQNMDRGPGTTPNFQKESAPVSI